MHMTFILNKMLNFNSIQTSHLIQAGCSDIVSTYMPDRNTSACMLLMFLMVAKLILDGIALLLL